MIIPLCSGMERSGSTVAWQIVKCLAPQTRPLNWDPGCDVKGWTGHPADWPLKRHDYMAGDKPVIYSYRHPVEAFLSLRRCFMSDVGTREDYDHQYANDHAGRLILEAAEVYELYKSDRKNGRPVLFLRYEDYYSQPALRIKDISTFMLMVPKLRPHEVNELLEFTSIKKNAKRAGSSFHNQRDEWTGIQGQHIDKENWGQPGGLLKKYRPFVKLVKNDPKLSEMRDACRLMRYKL